MQELFLIFLEEYRIFFDFFASTEILYGLVQLVRGEAVRKSDQMSAGSAQTYGGRCAVLGVGDCQNIAGCRLGVAEQLDHRVAGGNILTKEHQSVGQWAQHRLVVRTVKNAHIANGKWERTCKCIDRCAGGQLRQYAGGSAAGH